MAVVLACLLLSCSTPGSVRLALAPTPALVSEGSRLVAGVGACGFCHGATAAPNAPLSGGRVFSDSYGEVTASNLTSSASGLKAWDVNDLLRLFRTRMTPDGREISAELHAGFEWLADQDIYAVFAYLKQQPPVELEIEHRWISFFDRNTVGWWVSEPSVAGYVPAISERFPVQRGQYLADHVARCGSCHNTPGTLFTGGRYLGGGTGIAEEGKELPAPNISASEDFGIGGWTEAEIVKYLAAGVTPSGRFVDQRACPIPYFRNARRDELEAIAAYLKTVPAVE